MSHLPTTYGEKGPTPQFHLVPVQQAPPQKVISNSPGKSNPAPPADKNKKGGKDQVKATKKPGK